MARSRIFLLGVGCLVAAGAHAQHFDFESVPQYSPLPLTLTADGVVFHFSGEYSVQDVQQVIGLSPTGFGGHGLSPNSVFKADLTVSFTDLATGLPAYMEAASIDVAPQELACDTSSFLRISGYNGATLVGTRVDSAPGADSYTWPGFTLTLFTTDLFDPTVLFDRVVVSFESAPSTGGDWGPIFVADNFNAYPIPEPTSLVGAGLLTLCALRRRASGKI